MTGYIDNDCNIKSTHGLQQWMEMELIKKGYTGEIECVKLDNSIKIFFALGSTLNRVTINSHKIYLILTSQLEDARDEIIKIVNKHQNY